MKKSNLTVKERSVNRLTNFSVELIHPMYEGFEAGKEKYQSMSDDEKSQAKNAIKGGLIGAGVGLGTGVASTGISAIRNKEVVKHLVDEYHSAAKSFGKEFKKLNGKFPDLGGLKKHAGKLAAVKAGFDAVHRIPKHMLGGAAIGTAVGLIRDKKNKDDNAWRKQLSELDLEKKRRY